MEVSGRWRRNRTRLVTALSIALCLLVWGQLVQAAVANPSPVRYVTTTMPDGSTREGTRGYRCTGGSYVQGDTILRWLCVPADAPDGADGSFGRFDLATGKAEVLWTTPGLGIYVWIKALAQRADGDLAVMFDSGDVWHLHGNGQVENLRMPNLPEEVYFGAVRGLDWVGGSIEVVVVNEDGTFVYPYRPGSGWQTPRRAANPPCDETSICKLELAYRQDGVWRMVYSRVPSYLSDPDKVEADLLAGVEKETPQPIQTVPLVRRTEAFAAGHYQAADDGRFQWWTELLDRSPGNVRSSFGESAPLLLGPDGLWQPVQAPDLSGFDVPDYNRDLLSYEGLYGNAFLDTGRQRWIPQVSLDAFNVERVVALGDRWVALEYKGDNLRLRDLSTNRATGAVAREWFNGRQTFDGPYLSALVPATDGDLWLLGPSGAYVKIDSEDGRVYGLGLGERIGRVVDNFDLRREPFFRSGKIVKLTEFLLLLGFLPVAAAVVWVAQRVRPGLSGVWMARVSLVYLAIFLFSYDTFQKVVAVY